MENKQIAHIIKQLCLKKGFSINRLIQECNLTKSFIYDLERRNTSPSVDKIHRIADYLDCSVDYLLGRTDDDTPTSFKNKCQETICSRLAEALPYYDANDLEALGYQLYYLEELIDSNCIPLHLLLDIVDTLKISLDYLFGYSNDFEMNTSENDLLENSLYSQNSTLDEKLKFGAEPLGEIAAWNGNNEGELPKPTEETN